MSVCQANLTYPKNGYETTLASYFIKPDAEFIVKKYEERTKFVNKEISILPSQPHLSTKTNRFNLV